MIIFYFHPLLVLISLQLTLLNFNQNYLSAHSHSNNHFQYFIKFYLLCLADPFKLNNFIL